MAIIKNIRTSVGEGVERREPLRAVEKFNLAQCFWKIL
jgi:hypothetical protein